MDVDPDRILGLGIAGANKILPNARGDARDLLYEWLRVLSERDISTVETLLVDDSEHAAEMRNMAVFVGVLSQSERRSILDAVYKRAEYKG
ncbi:hypothetical protein Q9R20_06435 [Microbacterium sp. PRF11]|uniref:hypothetical protein n=1 Tax=Microbacterium sp. PRF11 TaxID=2962593 RepID=UPI002881AF23|nr:hypothetical protein [Microbacterium sp. PRF11]MDT0116625.1 hypothetical protein [Microbacterium sp. PRF11]